MKNVIKLLSFLTLIILVQILSCSEKTILDANPCVKGKFVGSYCSGYIIKIEDNSEIGKDWKNMFTNEIITNSVLASIDTTLYKHLNHPETYFSKDSIFFFKYRDGGYPPKQYVLCAPEPFITITNISKEPCNITK